MTMIRWSAVAATVGLAIAGGSVAFAQQQTFDPTAVPGSNVPSVKGPWLGVWKRNAEKSSGRMGPGGGTTLFKMTPNGDGFSFTIESTGADGKKRYANLPYGRFDGLPYPETGNGMADFNKFQRVNDRTYSVTDVKDGKEVIHITITISEDGKTRTSVSKMRNEKGEEVTNTGVWDRVE